MSIRGNVRRLRSIWNAARWSAIGATMRDKALIFQLIAFEATSFDNVARRDMLRRRVSAAAESGKVRVTYDRDGVRQTVLLRQDDTSDYSIAAEFFKEAYRCPPEVPKQIIDGGANIGAFAILANARFPNSPLHCYEPNASNIAAMRDNLQANGIVAHIHQAALWSHDGEVLFQLDMAYSGRVVSGSEEASVRIVTVPAVLPVVCDDCWMKLDIEGAEYEVLPALFAAGQFPRWISAELHFYDNKGFGLLDLMESHGYRLDGPRPPADRGETTIFATRD